MPYRLIYAGLGLVAVAAVIFGFVLSPEGETVELPDPVEAVSPAPGSQVPLQTTLEIDLEIGYIAEVWVDGWPIPVEENGPNANPANALFERATGVIRWSPTPANPTISSWTPGEHTVRIVWNTYTGLPDTGSFEWSFRVG